ncbi:MAG: hypothetical protein ACOH1V_02250 [Stenotrophomonas sp.]
MTPKYSRTELEAALDALAARIDTLVAEADTRQEDVLEEFAGEAEEIEERTAVEDRTFLDSRINCILASAGLIPGDSEGEPCK